MALLLSPKFITPASVSSLSSAFIVLAPYIGHSDDDKHAWIIQDNCPTSGFFNLISSVKVPYYNTKITECYRTHFYSVR